MAKQVDPYDRVEPYYYTFSTTVKGRWLDRTVLGVFNAEFPHHTTAYYEKALVDGRLWVERREQVVARERKVHAKRREISKLLHRGDATLPSDEIDDEEEEVLNTGSIVTPADTVLKSGDMIHHRLHRHELPILRTGSVQLESFLPLASIEADGNAPEAWEGFVIVNKPVSVPVHPCGRYRKNSLQFLLKSRAVDSRIQQPESLREKIVLALRSKIYPCHRLDKCTSGALVVATCAKAAVTMHRLLSDKSDEQKFRDGKSTDGWSVRKEYLARVLGKFPEGTTVVDAGVFSFDDKEGRWACLTADQEQERRQRFVAAGDDGDETCQRVGSKRSREEATTKKKEQEQKTRQGLDSTKHSHADRLLTARWAYTRFKLRSYDEVRDESIVECYPTTGRTHQIRLHLAYLGFPILLDRFYTDSRHLPSSADVDAFLARQKTSLTEERMSSLFCEEEATQCASSSVNDPATADVNCPECTGDLTVKEDGDGIAICLHSKAFVLSRERNGELRLEVAAPKWAE